MGFPNESRKELGQTVSFLARMGLAGVHDMSISLFSPYPGSELYHELRKSGRIPELSDEYFLGLCAYKDFSQSISYTEGLSPRVLNMLSHPRDSSSSTARSTPSVHGGSSRCSGTWRSTARNRGSTSRCRTLRTGSATAAAAVRPATHAPATG